MGEQGLGLALKFGDDSLSQHLTQLDAPLVERVKVPDHTLREDRVFVEGDESAERFRRSSRASPTGRFMSLAIERARRPPPGQLKIALTSIPTSRNK
jgi:hypothetical protein